MLVNCTPHTIVIMDSDNNEINQLPPSGSLARAKETVEIIGTVKLGDKEVPLRKKTVGGLEGLPEPEEGTWYVVSFIAGQAAKLAGRTDVLVTDDAVRDPSGRVIGCRAFSLL